MNKYIQLSIIPYMLLWLGYSYIGEYRMFMIGFIPVLLFIYYYVVDKPLNNITIEGIDK